MARSRYVILEPDKTHFLTCTVVEWLPVFTRPDSVQILLDSWSHQGLSARDYHGQAGLIEIDPWV